MKNCTDINQSKKLAEILPIESADMHWQYIEEDNGQLQWFCFPKDFSINQHDNIPCWSLAALLGVLPILDKRSPVMPKAFYGKYRVVYHSTAYERAIFTHDHDNPVDACYEMILKLYELKLL